MNFILGIIASAAAALAAVIDSFNRSDNPSDLGSVSGQKWKIWRGLWAIVSNKASSSSSPGDNALATLTFTKTDVTVSVSGQDPGTGASFWVTDANNWYASVYTQTQVCQTCATCSGTWNTANCASNAPGNCGISGTFCCGTFNTSNCIQNTQNGPANIFNSANSGNMAPPYGFPWGPSRNWVCTGGFNTSTCNANCCNGEFNTWSPYCVSWNTVNCNQFSFFQCNCTTEHRVNVIRSLSGTISTLSQNLFSAVISSFRTVLSGNTATITAFSSENYVNQIGNSVATNISPAPIKTTKHGIIKSTSPFSQGSTINDFGAS